MNKLIFLFATESKSGCSGCRICIERGEINMNVLEIKGKGGTALCYTKVVEVMKPVYNFKVSE